MFLDIIADGITKRFGAQTVLDGFSYTFEAGSVTCVTGQSGRGKTTLLHVLMGLLPPDSGTVRGLGSGKIAAVFQEDRLCENLSAVSNVRLVCADGQPKVEIEAALGRLGLADSLRKPARELSGGMRRRVALVRALIVLPEVLFLDEPFKGLDIASRKNAAGLILEYMQSKTVVMVSHDDGDAALLRAEKLELR